MMKANTNRDVCNILKTSISSARQSSLSIAQHSQTLTQLTSQLRHQSVVVVVMTMVKVCYAITMLN